MTLASIFEDKDYMLWRLFAQVFNAVFKARKKELMRYELTPRQAGILTIALDTNGTSTSYKIAKWLVLERHSISEMTNRMEKQGLIKKVSNLENRKTSRLELTKKGYVAAQSAKQYEAYHKIFSCLSKEQRQYLTDILRALRAAAFEEIGVRGTMPFPPY